MSQEEAKQVAPVIPQWTDYDDEDDDDADFEIGTNAKKSNNVDREAHARNAP